MKKKIVFFIATLISLLIVTGCKDNPFIRLNGETQSLTDEWSFYPSVFLFSDHNECVPNLPIVAAFPFNPESYINTGDHSNNGSGCFGYGTLLKNIYVETGVDIVYLKVPEIPSSYNLWINGIYRDSVGVPGKSRSETTSEYRIDFYELKRGRDFAGNTVEVAIEYANFTNRMAAITKPLTLHTRLGFEYSFFMSNFIILLVDGVLLFLFIYYMLLFLQNRVFIQNLYFSLFAFSLFLRQVILGQEITSAIFYGLSWHFKYSLWYILIIVQLWLYNKFISSMFKHESSKIVTNILSVICVIYSLFCAVTPPHVFTATLILPQITALLFGVFVHIVIIKAIINKRKGAVMVIAGNFVMFAAVINDILYSHGLIQTGRLLTIGALVFIIAQANLLAVIYTDNIRKIAMVTDRLSLINTIYGYFVPAGLTALFNKEKSGDITAGDFIQKKMCVMILDIREFTALSENMSAKECFDFINGFLSRFVPIIRQCGGFVTGFAGDQINALFTKSSDGLEGAIKIGRSLMQYNKQRTGEGLREIQIGIGLCTGEVILGISGNEKRVQLTAVSDDVQRAIFLETMTKYSGSMIIADQSVLNDTDDSARLSSRRIGRYTTAGGKFRDAYEMIYSYMSKDKIKRLETKYIFERSVKDLEAGRVELAETELNALLKENPDDNLIKWYIKVLIGSIVKGKSVSVSLDGLYEI